MTEVLRVTRGEGLGDALDAGDGMPGERSRGVLDGPGQAVGERADLPGDGVTSPATP